MNNDPKYPDAPPPPGLKMWSPKHDTRPDKGLYAAGEYLCRCRKCFDYFIGDKRSFHCADCAYEPINQTNL